MKQPESQNSPTGAFEASMFAGEDLGNERHFAEFFKLAVDLLCIADRDGKLRLVNPSWERALGYTLPEVTGRSFFDFVHPDDRAITQNALKNLLGGQPVVNFVNRYLTKSGDVRFLEWHSSAMGENGLTYAIARDVTEQRRILDKLSANEQLVHDAAIMAKIGGWEVPLPEKIPRWSEQVFRIHEVEVGQQPDITRAIEFYAPEARPVLIEAIERAMQEGTPWDLELPFVPAKGNQLWVRTLGRAEFRNGVCIRLIGSFQDITERRKVAEDLEKARAAAEEASYTKGQFLANMSHELRTPMNGIIGMAAFALETKLDEEQRDYIQTIKTSADSLLTILNDILDFSKIEAGKLDIVPEAFDPRGLVERVVDLLEIRASEKSILIHTHLDSKIPEAVVSDHLRIGQVLINLLGNATKFTPEGGAIGVSVEVSELNNDQVVLKFGVSDSGIGISEEKRQAIFEEFSQADYSTSRKYGGTGLGLAISRRLVEMMGGEIWVESKVDTGSAFYFTIKAAVSSCSQADVASRTSSNMEPLAPCPPLTILLAEDNPVNQKLAKKVLEKRGHLVTLASNGVEALKFLDESRARFDVILMDCQMPHLNGFETTQAIREREFVTGQRHPIVAMTANAMTGDRERCIEAGMDDYISKPFVSRELIAMVEGWATKKANG
jgi:PAS domain S-box-containing protein